MENLEQIKKDLLKHGYEYMKPAGKGSYSSVFLCKSTIYNNFFAVKRVQKSAITELEYNALVKLDHPSIIKLYEAFKESNSQYLVMEYCPNGTLKERGKLDYNEFVQYAKQTLEALQYCHSKMIAHRDIKPENIFLDKYKRAKLADFGFAKKFDDEKLSFDKCGSLMFCAPELLTGQSSNPFLADIWSLGTTFFYLATGINPFPNDTKEILIKAVLNSRINYLNINIDHRIQALIMKMTAKDPNSRASIESLLELQMFTSIKFKKITNFTSIYSMVQNRKMITSSTGFHSHFHLNKFQVSENNNDKKIVDEQTNECREAYKRTPHIYKSVICTPYVNKVNFVRK